MMPDAMVVAVAAVAVVVVVAVAVVFAVAVAVKAPRTGPVARLGFGQSVSPEG